MQLAFRRYRDTTPTAFLRQVRLEQARAELSRLGGEASVTAVMTRWHFGNVGRFAKRYREAFGELPSETARRGRRRAETTPVEDDRLT